MQYSRWGEDIFLFNDEKTKPCLEDILFLKNKINEINAEDKNDI